MAQNTIESQRSLEKKSVPLTVQSMEGAVVRNTNLFLFHIKMFQVRIPGEVKSLYSLRYLQIDYYINFNKLEFDVPEIYDVVLKV